MTLHDAVREMDAFIARLGIELSDTDYLEALVELETRASDAAGAYADAHAEEDADDSDDSDDTDEDDDEDDFFDDDDDDTDEADAEDDPKDTVENDTDDTDDKKPT
jgi:hypothetical protein